jgi:catalase
VPGDEELYEQIIEAANAIYGRHENARALHAKGTWCAATFTATSEATRLSRAPHLQGDPVTALIRFSNAGGHPESEDFARDGRGMAAKLRPEEGNEADILATTAPTFVARTPEDFLELMRLRKPEPETGQPDMAKVGAYIEAHPEALPAIQAVLGAEPPASFATLTYFSPHAFRLLSSDGDGTWVRWHWRPEAGERRIPDDEAQAKGRDYLRTELADRLERGPVGFELILQLAGEGDSLEDPTERWPEDREEVVAGRLEIERVVEDPERDGHIDVFDPMRLPDGIEPSNDPILHARPHAYSVSAYARWDRAEG